MPASPLAPAGGGRESHIEVDYVCESGTPQLLSGPWRAVEIWTQNRIYGVDSTLRCAHVADRATGAPVADHPAIGARLLGGQRRTSSGDISQVAHPLPEPGMSAVFSSGMGSRLRVSETSPVTRVVLRQRLVEVGSGATPNWESIAGPTR